MYTVPGCKIINKIYESSASLVFRGIREADGLPVVLKILKEDYPSPDELVRYRQEYEITRDLDLPGVIKAYAQEKYGNTLAIVLEDFGGESLRILREKRDFSLIEVLKLGIRISGILGEIHGTHVIHKDINPSNIVYNPDSDQLKVIDFGLSTKLSREMPVLKNPERLEGTLAYMSPEQTGRMNRALDYRTDFYALGVTLYELLTGRLPFTTQDPLELTHAHLAREPVSPGDLNEEIPLALSQVLLKLLAKRAEDRYQTARGLKADLEYCLGELEGNSNGDGFMPGGMDVSAFFQLPQKLYGRESELETLLYAAERAAMGGSEALFVAGYSGVGKSALVNELCGKLIRPGVGSGYFISGKFDQYHRDIPYSAARDAFRELIRQLLTESEEQLSRWKAHISGALGPNGRLMTEFLPELELVIGEQAPVPELDAGANRNRFTLTLRNFVEVFLRREHPLVIFLDDLQWADLASLDLIKLITTKSNFLFLIGAYRDNEVEPGHPLLMTADDMQAEGTPLSTITLAPLDLTDIQRYVADATLRNVSETDDLADLLKHKTAGNPFFLGEFLKTMVREELLSFDESSRSWLWEITRIQEQNITDNVVELMAERVRHLDTDTKSALAEAACLGNTFDLATLALLHEKSPAETAGDLWPALELNMLLPLRDEYKIAALAPLDILIHETEIRFVYKFAHDRIEEASYGLLSTGERQSLHLKAGRLLLKRAAGKERMEEIFAIVDHLNMGRELMEDQGERDESARLNRQAGARAQASTAYGPALEYSKMGLELLRVAPENPWRRTYALTLSLTSQAAEAALLARNFSEMETFTQEALDQAENILDKAKIYEVQLQSFVARNDLAMAVNTALLALKKLGINLPNKPGKIRVIIGLLLTRLRLAGKSPDDILNLPEMQDPTARAAGRILEKASTSAYFSIPELYPLLNFQIIKLTLKYGNTNETPTGFNTYGIVFSSLLGDIENGYKYGKLALHLMEHLNVIQSRAKSMLLFNYFIRHWKEPLQTSIRPLREAHKIALETGDLEFAALALYTAGVCSLLSGSELAELEKKFTIQVESSAGLGQETSRNYLSIILQVVQHLRIDVQNPSILVGNAYDETTMLPLHKESQDKTALFIAYFYKLMLSYIFQEPSSLIIQYAAETEKYMEGARGSVASPVFYFYDSLAQLKAFPDASTREQKRIRKKVISNQKKLRKWSDHTPSNHLHRFYLVGAEEARVLGRDESARKLYDQAIKQARENDYLNDEALAWELAGYFYMEYGPDYSVRFYLDNARYAYSRWGAVAKVRHLEKLHPEVFTAETPDSTAGISTTTSTSTTGRSSSGALDLFAIMKASQTITGETELEQLLRKLMEVVLENAGARRGILLLRRGENWFIEAQNEPGQEDISLLQSLPLEAGDLPLSLINYVIRTQEKVVLDHASRSGPFMDDPYILKLKSRSILCLPLIHQGQLIGLLYLGNNLTEGAFTRDRLEVMEILSAQIAISIQIALSREAERARIKAEAANRAKSEFLAGMSHELRTPLNGILGYAQILNKSKSLTDMEQEGVNTIHNSGKHLLTLIDDILDLSKIEAERLELFPTDLRLSELLESITTLFRVQAREKKLSFYYEPLTALPSGIQADEKRLRQILFNLLSNAMRYTKQGQVVFRAAHENEKLRFEVEDTGIGIKAEDQQKIFEPFRQAGGIHSAHAGTGLGLSICVRLADMMGGRLSLESTPGAGSTFTFEVSLPETAVIAAQDAVRKTILGYSGPRLLILIVDDNAANRGLLRNLLGPLGFESAEAKDGQEALAIAREKPPHLVFMDSAMPVMDGFECTREIRRDPVLKDTPIIAISAGVFEKDRQAGLEAGANTFLSKPIDVEKLLIAVGDELHLEWDYEHVETPETLPEPGDPADIVGPPPAEAKILLELAKRGDIGAVLEFANDLEGREPELTPFTKEVRRLANAFQERKLTDFVEKFTN